MLTSDMKVLIAVVCFVFLTLQVAQVKAGDEDFDPKLFNLMKGLIQTASDEDMNVLVQDAEDDEATAERFVCHYPRKYIPVPFYRYFNGREHFYTTNVHEIGTTTPGHRGKHGYHSEGYQARIYTVRVPGSVPLYRYWNGPDHFYTTNGNEIGTTQHGRVGRYNYRCEGIAGYCFPRRAPGLVPLYRGYGRGEHFYTTDRGEIHRARFHYEGIQCFVVPK